MTVIVLGIPSNLSIPTIQPQSEKGQLKQNSAHLDVVGMLVVVGGVEDDLGTRLGVDISWRNRLSHLNSRSCDLTLME